MLPGISFADAESTFEEADFVIYGVPFDRTTSFRPGTREGPHEIRKSSYNFETFMFEHEADTEDIKLHDLGNMDDFGLVDHMVAEGEVVIGNIVANGKFPIVLGGEHSVTIPAVRSFEDISYISIDAHLDFRDSHLGERNSHACVTKRCADHLGLENVFVIGCRSISKEEWRSGPLPGYLDSYTVFEIGIEKAVKEALDSVGNEKVYISLDIDGIDPAFAPGTGTPEPFGLTPYDVKKLINIVGDRMVGFDVVEVSPIYDNGNTAALAARMVREAICVATKHRS